MTTKSFDMFQHKPSLHLAFGIQITLMSVRCVIHLCRCSDIPNLNSLPILWKLWIYFANPNHGCIHSHWVVGAVIGVKIPWAKLSLSFVSVSSPRWPSLHSHQGRHSCAGLSPLNMQLSALSMGTGDPDSLSDGGYDGTIEASSRDTWSPMKQNLLGSSKYNDTILLGFGITILKIKWFHSHLSFLMGILRPGSTPRKIILMF